MRAPGPDDIGIPAGSIVAALDEAHTKALHSLARYKFWMFGYWSARWVGLNALLPSGLRRPNPFRSLVDAARSQIGWPRGGGDAS